MLFCEFASKQIYFMRHLIWRFQGIGKVCVNTSFGQDAAVTDDKLCETQMGHGVWTNHVLESMNIFRAFGGSTWNDPRAETFGGLAQCMFRGGKRIRCCSGGRVQQKHTIVGI